MKEDNKDILLTIPFAVVLALVPTIGIWVFFKSNFPLTVLIFLSVIKLILVGIYKNTAGILKIIVMFVSYTYSVLFGLFIFISIIIIPFINYSIWFESFQNGQIESGAISNLFTFITCFASSYFAGIVYSKEYIWPPIGLALTIAILFAIAMQNTSSYIIVGALFILCLFYISYKYSEKGNYIKTLIYLLAVFIFTIGLGYTVLVYSPFNIKGIKLIDKALYPYLRKTIAEMFPDYPLVMEIPEYGFSINTENIGEKQHFSQEKLYAIQVTEKETGQSLYLRVFSYDYYNNFSWENSFKPETVTVEETSCIHEKSDTLISMENYLKLKLLQLYNYNLPYILNTEELIFEMEPPKIKWGNFDIGFILDSPLKLGNAYYIKLNDKTSIPTLKEREHYLQVPENISEEVLNLAASFQQYNNNPEQQLKEIEEYLAINYTFVFNKEEGALSTPFLDNFLFKDKKGSSIHFATAFIILARLNSIPSRFVTGYLVHVPEIPGKIFITGYSSHSWAEVWFEGEGWNTWEATAALNPSYYSIKDGYWFYNYNMIYNDDTKTHLSHTLIESNILSREEMEAETKIISTEGEDINWSIFIYPAVFMIISLFLLLLAVKYHYLLRYALIKNKKTALILARQIVKLQKRNKVTPPNQTGWWMWCENLSDKFTEKKDSIMVFKNLIMEIVYANKNVLKNDVTLIYNFYKKVGEKRIQT